MKFAICNLGCKVNNFEANWYAQQLAQKYEEVDFKQAADIYVINSCTVTNMAGSKSRQMIHQARKRNPQAVIAAVGCYVQMEFTNSEIFRDCDILIGSKNKKKLPEYIDQYLKDHKRIIDVEDFEVCAFEEMFISHFNQTRAYLKIQDGCNQFCSYCTIPLARGRERCLGEDRVLAQASKLVESGHQEIVLTGIHTGRWHDGERDLADLIGHLLDDIPGLKRIRLSSIEMTEVSDKLIEQMINNPRVARHLHIPLQTGTDRLLKLNNRPYTTEQYRQRIEEIRQRIPDISLSSDIIAGLPTESDQEHEETMQFIADCRLSFLHVFPYAKKEHTYDSTLKQVPEIIKKQRAAGLTKLSEQLYNEYISSFINQDVEVLFERYDEQLLKGHCSQYINVEVNSESDLTHQIHSVHIDSISGDRLIGHLK